MSYDEVLIEAWESVIADYKKGLIKFDKEFDFQSYLYAKCLEVMKKKSLPVKIYVERDYPEGLQPDLVLGDNEVAVELKFGPGGSSPAKGKVEDDLKKLKRLIERVEVAYFLALDHRKPDFSSILRGLESSRVKFKMEKMDRRNGGRFLAFLVREARNG